MMTWKLTETNIFKREVLNLQKKKIHKYTIF